MAWHNDHTNQPYAPRRPMITDPSESLV